MWYVPAVDRPNLELFRVLFAYLIALQYRKERSVLGIPIWFQDQKFILGTYIVGNLGGTKDRIFLLAEQCFRDVAEGPPSGFRRFLGDVAISKLVRDYGYFGEVFRFILSVARPFIVRSHRWNVAEDEGFQLVSSLKLICSVCSLWTASHQSSTSLSSNRRL